MARRQRERNQDQCCSRVARGEPQHAAQLGAPVRLPQAPPHRRRPPPVRARGARGAAPRAARDAQHLLGDRGRAPARRGPQLAQPPARRLRPLRRARPPTACIEESLAVRSVDRTVEEVLLPAIEMAEGREAPRGRVGAGVPLGHRVALRRPSRRAARLARPGRASCSTPPSAWTTSRCTCRRSSWPSAAPGFRSLLLSFDLPPERVARAMRAVDPTAFVFCGGEATLEVLGRLVYTVRQVGSAAPGVRVPRVDARHRRSRDPVAGHRCPPRPPSGSSSTWTPAAWSRWSWWPRAAGASEEDSPALPGVRLAATR